MILKRVDGRCRGAEWGLFYWPVPTAADATFINFLTNGLCCDSLARIQKIVGDHTSCRPPHCRHSFLLVGFAFGKLVDVQPVSRRSQIHNPLLIVRHNSTRFDFAEAKKSDIDNCVTIFVLSNRRVPTFRVLSPFQYVSNHLKLHGDWYLVSAQFLKLFATDHFLPGSWIYRLEVL